MSLENLNSSRTRSYPAISCRCMTAQIPVFGMRMKQHPGANMPWQAACMCARDCSVMLASPTLWNHICWTSLPPLFPWGVWYRTNDHAQSFAQLVICRFFAALLRFLCQASGFTNQLAIHLGFAHNYMAQTLKWTGSLPTFESNVCGRS